MIGRSGVGSITAITASQISTAKSGSVPVKLSGRVLVADVGARERVDSNFLHSAAALTAMSMMPARSRPNTTRRCSSEVEL